MRRALRLLCGVYVVAGLAANACSDYATDEALDGAPDAALDALDASPDRPDGGDAADGGDLPDGGGDAEADAFADGGVTDSGDGGDGGDAGDGGDVACPSEMVLVNARAGAYCIDAHEVSRERYLSFVNTASTLGQPPRCAWNNSFVPQSALANGDPSYPVVGVDFCDALAYCTSVGKHLCGRIHHEQTGAPVQEAEQEWLVACTRDLSLPWPYGDTYVEGACAVSSDGGASHSSTTPNACEGGYKGLFDMVGNVWEWVDFTIDTSDAGPSKDGVAFHGGSYGFGDVTTCRAASGFPRSATASDVGFRCCK
ncbi:MAG: SUMF1/EgtB/PvdO family nonheme iron enzyme [Labilithrix sp.]